MAVLSYCCILGPELIIEVLNGNEEEIFVCGICLFLSGMRYIWKRKKENRRKNFYMCSICK
jgi:hypothetical protein